MMTGALGMSNFREIDRDTGFLLPPSVDEWLPEKHLARFVVEVIDGLDLSAMSKQLSRVWVCVLPPGAAPGLGRLGLRYGRVFEPQAGAGNLRLGGVPIHRRERTSRPRH